ncbi:MAG: hypothetical protein AAF648_09370 [Pseudomonadota bacterium]
MEHTITIDPQRNLIVVSLRGEFEFADVKAAVEELMARPDYRASLNALYDLRGVTFGAVSSDALQKLSFEIADPSWDGTRFALVADDDDVFGICRIYCAVASESGEQQRKAFRDFDSAEQWVLH